MKLKKFLVYLLFLVPWFVSSLIFRMDTSYYQGLNLPFFAPPPFLFGIIWPILYILIAYSVYKTWNISTSNYKIYLIINYVANQLFTLAFFVLKNNFLALVDTIIIFISSLYLYVETRNINKDKAKYLIPYIIWNAFALILIFSVFIMN